MSQETKYYFSTPMNFQIDRFSKVKVLAISPIKEYEETGKISFEEENLDLLIETGIYQDFIELQENIFMSEKIEKTSEIIKKLENIGFTYNLKLNPYLRNWVEKNDYKTKKLF